eukprot:COSAG02_NODE_58363_length_277_cov_1.168539_1_plen_44_part_01
MTPPKNRLGGGGGGGVRGGGGVIFVFLSLLCVGGFLNYVGKGRV